MKKIILILIVFLCSFSVFSQDITGQWNSVLKINGTQFTLIFHIEKTETGYSSTVDSPDQNAKGIPVTFTTFENNILNMKVVNLGIEYTAELNSENKFVGTFKQSGNSAPLTLSRETVEKEIPARPQEPVKPYPYYSEDVKFKNEKDKIFLAGTLTLPKKEGRYPVVVMITGSGPQNRDEELLGHKPFLIIADHLTRNGIGVLRFDDRGTFESQGNFKTATTIDFASDVEAAVKYLQTRNDIDENKIGLVGHSEGGLIAPMIAANDKDISFIVLLAGPGIPGDQLLLLQGELIEKANGESDEKIQKLKVINKGAYDIVLKSTDTEKLKAELKTYFIQAFKNDSSDVTGGMSVEGAADMEADLLSSPWFKFFLKYDPAESLKKVKCPVLAINGAKDLQVPAEIDLNAIKRYVDEGGNKNVTTKELPDLNHLFQECETGSPDEYSKIVQTFSPVALKEITDWILLQTK